ncbi:MAG: hypothetical protein AAF902_18945 [Chloroflexota bacterium]
MNYHQLASATHKEYSAAYTGQSSTLAASRFSLKAISFTSVISSAVLFSIISILM